MAAPDLPSPVPVRADVLEPGDAEAVVATGVGDLELLVMGWFESHTAEGGRGAHLALRQARRAAAETLVVHVSRVPVVVAALTEVALRLTRSWERDGERYWAGQPAPGGTGPQDPEGPYAAPPRTEVSDDDRRARRRDKLATLDRVHEHAGEVLRIFVAAEDDEQAAAGLAALLGTTEEVAQDLVRHLQFRELTASARRQAFEQAEL